MTDEEAAPILYAMAVHRRARAKELRALPNAPQGEQRAQLHDDAANAIDHVMARLGLAYMGEAV